MGVDDKKKKKGSKGKDKASKEKLDKKKTKKQQEKSSAKKKGKAKKESHKAPRGSDEHWLDRVKHLRERSFEEAIAASERANARLANMIGEASLAFANELEADFVDDQPDDALDELSDDSGRRYSNAYVPALDTLLENIDHSSRILNDGKGLPRLREEFAGGVLVVRAKAE